MACVLHQEGACGLTVDGPGMSLSRSRVGSARCAHSRACPTGRHSISFGLPSDALLLDQPMGNCQPYNRDLLLACEVFALLVFLGGE